MIGDDAKLLFHRRRNLYRATRNERQRRDERFELNVGLGPEAAAEHRHPDAHLVFRPAEQTRDLEPHERWHLAGGVNRDGAVTRLGDREERFECGMLRGWVAKRMLEHAMRRAKGALDVAAAQSK